MKLSGGRNFIPFIQTVLTGFVLQHCSQKRDALLNDLGSLPLGSSPDSATDMLHGLGKLFPFSGSPSKVKGLKKKIQEMDFLK